MRHCKKALAAAAVLFLTGCVPALHPLYTEKDTVFDPALLGTWIEEDGKDTRETWTFHRGDAGNYDLRHTEDGEMRSFRVHLVAIGAYRYLDFYPGELEIDNGFYKAHLMPVHHFARIERAGDRFSLRMLDVDWIKKQLKRGAIQVKHETVAEDLPVLTASTGELQRFFRAIALERSAFTPPEVYRRKP